MRAVWPNADASRFVRAAGLRWHVQVMGRGPVALLLHGTGAASHSWRDVAPALAAHFTVVAPDLPGHGFTTRPPAERMSLAGMAADVAALLSAMGLEPVIGAGHSAGAAVLMRMALDGVPLAAIVGINAALVAPPPAYTSLLAPAVNAVATLPLVAKLAARAAAGGTLPRSLLKSTGSRTSAEQAALYAAFMASPEHNGAVLTMMANWNLPSLLRDLPRLTTPVTLLMAADDPWVRARDVSRIARAIPCCETVTVPHGGHLLHEEQPEVAVRVILDAARRAGIGPATRVRAAP